MSAIEQRISRGEAHTLDIDWLVFLDEIFGQVALADMVKAGMDAESARRLVSVLALVRRYADAHDEAA